VPPTARRGRTSCSFYAVHAAPPRERRPGRRIGGDLLDSPPPSRRARAGSAHSPEGVQTALDIASPVYALLTKCDLLPGFVDCSMCSIARIGCGLGRHLPICVPAPSAGVTAEFKPGIRSPRQSPGRWTG